MFAREFRNQIGRNERRIGQGLVELAGQFIESIKGWSGELQRVVVATEIARYQIRIAGFVMARTRKRNCKGLDARGGHALGGGSNQTGIQPAGQKYPHWNVTAKSQAHRIQQELAHSISQRFSVGIIRSRVLRQSPVSPGCELAAVEIEIPGLGAGKLEDAGTDTELVRHIAQCKIEIQRAQAQSAAGR